MPKKPRACHFEHEGRVEYAKRHACLFAIDRLQDKVFVVPVVHARIPHPVLA